MNDSQIALLAGRIVGTVRRTRRGSLSFAMRTIGA